MYIGLFQRYLEVTKMTVQTDLNKICIYCTVFNIEYQVDKHMLITYKCKDSLKIPKKATSGLHSIS